MNKNILHRKLSDNVYAIALRVTDSCDGKYSVVVPPTTRYWYADPVVCELNGETYLFAEQYDRFFKKGYIAVFHVDIINGSVRCSKPKRILSEPFHLSFPLLFSRDQQWYMIPESSADNSLLIYKMGETPYDWEQIRRIPMTDSVDTVLCQKDDMIFFINTEEHSTKKLYGKQKIYSMTDFPYGELVLIGEEDDYSLERRNGGPIFESSDKIIRVCQNCTEKFYGKSFSFYEITELSPEGYQDVLQKTIEVQDLKLDKPVKRYEITGTHTFSRTDRVEAIDIFCSYFSVRNIFAKLIRKFF